jgi:hypothetical protein
MKKIFPKIIALALVTALTGPLLTNVRITASAQTANGETQERIETEPEKACKGKKPDFTVLKTEWKEAGFNDVFNSSQKAYHDYLGCLFDYAESTILKRPRVKGRNSYLANIPNIDWMDPPAACLSDDEIRKALFDTDHSQMLTPVLETHRDYKNHLESMANVYRNRQASSQTPSTIGERAGTAAGIERRIKSEIDSALVALDLAFTSLKELRLAFTIHVRFQCLLKHLEKYRKVLGEIRTIVVALPNKLRDASVTQ